MYARLRVAPRASYHDPPQSTSPTALIPPTDRRPPPPDARPDGAAEPPRPVSRKVVAVDAPPKEEANE